MPPRKRTPSVSNGNDEDKSDDGVEASRPDEAFSDALSLERQAEAAEVEAAEAEALAAAARARTRALHLRRQAEAAATKAAAAATKAASAAAPVDLVKAAPPADLEATEATEAVELDEPAHEELDESTVTDASLAVDEPARRRRLSMPHISLRIAAAALVVLVSLGLIGASAYMIVHHRQVEAEKQRSAEFAAAARQGVVTLMSLDFKKAEADVKRILDNTTGDFRKDFESQAKEFTKVAQESKVVTEATVNATAVDKMTLDTAAVLVAVTTNVSNTASKQQQPRSWRLMVDVARDGGQLKMAKVEFVP